MCPDGGYEQASAGCNEAEEEDEDYRMLVVHEVMPQTGTTIGDAAISKYKVKFAKRGGNMDYEEAVEEAYRCVSVDGQWRTLAQKDLCYLKAGRRPKKAIKVSSETVMVKTAMVRANDMMEFRTAQESAWRGQCGWCG